jgi:hypothetical protein
MLLLPGALNVTAAWLFQGLGQMRPGGAINAQEQLLHTALLVVEEVRIALDSIEYQWAGRFEVDHASGETREQAVQRIDRQKARIYAMIERRLQHPEILGPLKSFIAAVATGEEEALLAAPTKKVAEVPKRTRRKHASGN